MYEYRLIEVLRVVDADTIDCRISAGFGIALAFRFRLAGIDTPEVYGREASARGTEAKEFTIDWLERAQAMGPMRVVTFKGAVSTVGIGDGAFGRWLAAFVAADETDLASALRSAGYAQ